jgi:hypothetical protein
VASRSSSPERTCARLCGAPQSINQPLRPSTPPSPVVTITRSAPAPVAPPRLRIATPTIRTPLRPETSYPITTSSEAGHEDGPIRRRCSILAASDTWTKHGGLYNGSASRDAPAITESEVCPLVSPTSTKFRRDRSCRAGFRGSSRWCRFREWAERPLSSGWHGVSVAAHHCRRRPGCARRACSLAADRPVRARLCEAGHSGGEGGRRRARHRFWSRSACHRAALASVRTSVGA